MELKVNIYLGDKLVKKEDLHKLQIKSATIDRIINDATRRSQEKELKESVSKEL